MQHPNLWKAYQSAIAELFRRLEGAEVEEDVEELGNDSQAMRQLDVRIFFPMTIRLGQAIELSIPIKIVVDAKLHDRRLDVTKVGSLASLKEDIRANLLIAVSPKGASLGARKLAQNKGVYIITGTPDLLALLQSHEEPSSVTCILCERGTVSWNTRLLDAYKLLDGGLGLYLEGTCNYCGEVYLRCGDCGMVQAVPEGPPSLRCPGGCGSIAWVEFDPREDTRTMHRYGGLDVALLVSASRKSSGRLSDSSVQKIVDQTKWQHWHEASPTIRLTEEELMEWKDDGYLHITSYGRNVVSVMLKAVDSVWWDMNSMVLGASLFVMFGEYGLKPIPE